MSRRLAQLALIALAGGVALLAQDPLAEPGFVHFYNLEYDQALKSFREEAALHPDSPDALNHVAQTLLYREMFRSGALESQLVTGNNPFLRRPNLKPSPEEDKDFQDLIARAMTLAEEKLDTHPDDVPALYSLGVSYGLRTNYNFLVHKAWMDSLKDATAARKAHHHATEIDPAFIDARLVQGGYDYVVGSLPVMWKMLGFVAGYHGDRERGIATVRQVAEKGRFNRSDAAVMLCVMLRRERRPAEAVPYLEALVREYPRNFLLRLELVQMYGEVGEKDKALAVIAQVDEMKRTHAPGYDQLPEEKIRYTRGNLLFWYDDLGPALKDIADVTHHADAVDLNTGVYAWLRLGQIHDLMGQRDEALKAYQETIAYAPGSDAAHEAENYSKSRYKR